MRIAIAHLGTSVAPFKTKYARKYIFVGMDALFVLDCFYLLAKDFPLICDIFYEFLVKIEQKYCCWANFN